MSDEIIVGKCPFCNDGTIVEREKLFVCSNSKSIKTPEGNWITEGCKFRVFKDKFKGLGYPLISFYIMRAILEEGSLLVDLVSKRGKTYKGRIRIDKREGGVKMMFRNKFKNVRDVVE